MGPFEPETALLLAVRDTLRQRLALNRLECDIAPEGEGFAIADKTFLSVHEWAPVQQITYDTALTERYSVAVSVHWWNTELRPRDRQREFWIGQQQSLNQLCRQVRNAVHMNYTLMNLANNLMLDTGIEPSGYAPFYLPPKAVGLTSPERKSAAEFGIQGGDRAIMYRTVRFGFCDRGVINAEMTTV